MASKSALVGLVCGLTLCVCAAQQAETRSTTGHSTHRNSVQRSPKTLTADDGMAVISAALDRRVRREPGLDCSHLVHAIYERAGFPYSYATSDDLYDGVPKFQRVAHPQPGDLIVWHGHAGIVVRPSRHVFFSFMSAGPGVDDYISPYWRGRGQARFYRYVKEPCAGCTAISRTFGRVER